MKFSRGVCLFLSLVTVSCMHWRDGFTLAYHEQRPTINPGVPNCPNAVQIRYLQDATWHRAVFAPQNHLIACDGTAGLTFAQKSQTPSTILGFADGLTNPGIMRGIGVTFDENSEVIPRLGVSGAVNLVHANGNIWLFSYPDSNHQVQLVEFNDQPNRGFQPPITFSPPLPENNLSNAPAFAYDGQRAVFIWPLASGSRRFKYAVANHTAGTGQATVTSSGELPAAPGYVAEFQAAPSVAYDGAGRFYAAVLYRSGTSGLTQDALDVFTSADGAAWSPFTLGSIVPRTFATADTAHIRIAAAPGGVVAIALVTQRGGRLFMRDSAGQWTEVTGVFDMQPTLLAEMALAHTQYLSR